MTPPARALAVLLSASLIACGSGSGDGNLSALSERLLEPESSARQIAAALASFLGGSFEVREGTSANPFTRSFAVRRKDQSNGPFVMRELNGHVTIDERKGWVLARLSLRPNAFANAQPTHEALGRILSDAFPMLPDAQGRPVLPYAPEVWVRLARGGIAPEPAAGWELQPVRDGAPPTLILSTPSALDAQNASGFLGVFLKPPDADRVAMAELVRDLAAYVASLGASRPDPRGTPSWRQSRVPLRTRDPILFGDSLSEGLRTLATEPRVSGPEARLVAVLEGPGLDESSAFLEVGEVLLRATLKTREVPEDTRMLRSLPRLGRSAEFRPVGPGDGAAAASTGGAANAAQQMPGRLTWSGRLRGEAWDPYFGKVYQLRDVALEWKPLAHAGRIR